LPWRTFVYKALNTFIDDLFAFVIRQPTLSRLRVFRDGTPLQAQVICSRLLTKDLCLDIIFVIYLYQRWIYPVDKNRIEVPGDGPAININDANNAQQGEAKDNHPSAAAAVATTKAKAD